MAKLTDQQIDAIYEDAKRAAERAITFQSGRNPHPAGTREHSIWAVAYRNAYARENG